MSAVIVMIAWNVLQGSQSQEKLLTALLQIRQDGRPVIHLRRHLHLVAAQKLAHLEMADPFRKAKNYENNCGTRQ
ncbi:hypothetical protein FBQ96_13130 [Nitrospirales bacterium NOB]|nr:hypothetical protein [Nitrospirales bacterium NOB]